MRKMVIMTVLVGCQSAREARLESLVSCKSTSKDISLCEARVVPDVMGSVLEGGLSQQEVVSELKPLLPKMNKCYEQSIDRGNVESGSVVLEWTIAGNGEVQKLMWNREKSTSDDSQLSRCMTKLVKKAVFPKPRNGVKTTVTYPFKLLLPMGLE